MVRPHPGTRPSSEEIPTTATPAPPAAPSRAPHHQGHLALLVAAGGALGSLARYGVAHVLPPQHGWPIGTLAANLTGAFLLGALLEVLGRRGPETPGVQRVRLALGTGVLGGYTTFSSLALETERLLADGAVGTALGYAGVTLVAGVLAAAAGVALVGAVAGRAPRPAGSSDVDPDTPASDDPGPAAREARP